MPPLRVAVVTRRFWPLVGSVERLLARLGFHLQQLGCMPTIVTAQWDSTWPAHSDHSGIAVHRIARPKIRGWGSLRYLWNLRGWLRANHAAFDVALVSQLGSEAYMAVGALHEMEIPVLLRAEAGGPSGDCTSLRASRFGYRILHRCQQAEAIIAPGNDVAQELLQAGFDRQRLHVIANGVEKSPERSIESQQAARATLVDANRNLQVLGNAPVALTVGPLHANAGLINLLRAWRSVVSRWPQASLWIIGEGPERDRLYECVRDLELKYHVAMPGAFDDVTDLLAAADVLVQPGGDAAATLSILEANVAGVPVVASDLPPHRGLLDESKYLVPPKNPAALAAAIGEVFESPEVANQRASQRQAAIALQYSAESMALRHWELLQAIAANGCQR